nr:hypothetical protein [Tanacetum cinerariifolium]
MVEFYIRQEDDQILDREPPALIPPVDGDDVDVHLYRSVIGSLMYLTSSRPDIMFVCKKKIVVSTSTTEAEYMAAASCYGRVLWIQNQLLDYGSGTSHMVEFDIRQEDDQFWRTASVRTPGNRDIKLNATVDGQVKTITEACVRRHLKLADADGISSLPTTEIFKQLALMRGFSRVETTLFPTMLVTEKVSQGEGLRSPFGTQYIPTIIESSPYLQNISITYKKTRTRTGRMGIRLPQSNVPSRVVDEAITKEMHDGLGRATSIASSLAVDQCSGTITKTHPKATPSGPSSPRTSLEGGPGCHFTMRDSHVQARPKRLSNLPNEPPLREVTSLENELTCIKAVYNKALINLTKRVKKLEKQLKHKGRRPVIDSLDDVEPSLDAEDSPKQRRMIEELDKDKNVKLVQSSKKGEAQETTEHRIEFSTASPQTADDETHSETLLNIKRSVAKDKGKCIMQDPDLPKKIKERDRI